MMYKTQSTPVKFYIILVTLNLNQLHSRTPTSLILVLFMTIWSRVVQNPDLPFLCDCSSRSQFNIHWDKGFNKNHGDYFAKITLWEICIHPLWFCASIICEGVLLHRINNLHAHIHTPIYPLLQMSMP